MTDHRYLTQADLDPLRCATPGCRHDTHDTGVVLCGKCHPGRPVEASYRLGVLTLRCSRCLAIVGEIAVAAGPVSVQ